MRLKKWARVTSQCDYQNFPSLNLSLSQITLIKWVLSLESFINENNRLALIAEQTADAIIMHDSNLKCFFLE